MKDGDHDERQMRKPLHGAARSRTPFRLDLHVVDELGNTLVFGPTGAGMSMSLSMLLAQWRRLQEPRLTRGQGSPARLPLQQYETRKP